MEYTLNQVKPNIFLLSFDNGYDLAMTFLRYQEYYESPNPTFKRKIFTILDFMEWYSKQNDNKFSYAYDWGGFNIPSWVISCVLSGNIQDKNKYDILMEEIYRNIISQVGPVQSWYLIGATNTDTQILKHEIAHGLWYTTSAYKHEMSKLIQELPLEVKDVLKTHLLKNMYCEEVIDDEIQAYLSTGITDDMEKRLLEKYIDISIIEKQFQETFEKYYNS